MSDIEAFSGVEEAKKRLELGYTVFLAAGNGHGSGEINSINQRNGTWYAFLKTGERIRVTSLIDVFTSR